MKTQSCSGTKILLQVLRIMLDERNVQRIIREARVNTNKPTRFGACFPFSIFPKIETGPVSLVRVTEWKGVSKGKPRVFWWKGCL